MHTSFGNLIFYCRFGLHHCCTTITYVVHLGIAEIIVCAINMPVNVYSIFAKGWFAGKELCIFVAAFRYITIYAEWMIGKSIF